MKKTNGNLPVSTFSGMFDRLFQNNLNRVLDDDFWGFNGATQNVNVPVNIQEKDKCYEMQLVAPGLKKNDFKIRVHGDMLTVSFEHKEENNQENKNEGWLRKEYHRSSFTRNFSLDDAIDANKIEGKYEDGILHLTLPKKEGSQRISRAIEIN